MEKQLYIMKIGGSIATNKQSAKRSVRKELLFAIARSIKESQEKGGFDLVLIHGAGSFGHVLAQKYALKSGTGEDPRKVRGALLSRIANQGLDADITKIVFRAGLRIVPVHTASVITQDRGRIVTFDFCALRLALEKGYVPLLYGDMVFDETLGMSICSGDTIAASAALELRAQKIFFASDIDGVFDRDPHLFADAQLIERMTLGDIHGVGNISHSHSVDATGGLLGKLNSLLEIRGSATERIELFNGFFPENYRKALLGEPFPHSSIST